MSKLNPWLNQQTGIKTSLLVRGWSKVIVSEDVRNVRSTFESSTRGSRYQRWMVVCAPTIAHAYVREVEVRNRLGAGGGLERRWTGRGSRTRCPGATGLR